jgi:stage III sporulation protein AH
MFNFKKRKVWIFSLVGVLCLISYLNYAINKYSLLKTSKEFQRYEENKLAEISLDQEKSKQEEVKQNPIKDESNRMVEETSSNQAEEIQVTDSHQNTINDIVSATSSNIQNTITNNKNMKRTNYFIESRLSTNMERERAVEWLNEIINNERTDENSKKAANDEKMKLIDVMSREKIVENLIKAKGFEEALVFITDHSVHVIVETEKLTDSDMAKILDIVVRETNTPLDNIKILNKY